MAIFHLSIQVISRGKGRSAVAAAAYRAGERITNDYDGYTHDYTSKRDIVNTEIFLPSHAPPAYKDRTTLWNAVEKVEGNKNAQLAREIEFSLPIELSIEQNIALAHEYVKKHFVDKGMIADVCIHDKDGTNPHCHVMLILRPIEQDGSWGAKSRKEYILDENGERIKLPSGEYKSRKVYTVDWNDQAKAEEWRKGWADAVNATFEWLNRPERIDHRSFERQGNGLIPTIHMGVAASQMEKKGIATDKGNHNRQVAITNKEIKQTKARIRKVKNWLYAQPITNAPSMMDIMGGVAKGKNLKSQWQRVRNLQTSAKVLTFLTENNITDVERFADKVVQIHEQFGAVTKEIQAVERRLGTLAEHLAHAENHKKYKTLYEKYKSLAPKEPSGFGLFKKGADTTKQDAFYAKHADEIRMYQNAKRYLDGVMNGRGNLPIKEWQAEQGQLLAQRYDLCENYYSLKDETQSVETVWCSMENLMNESMNSVQQVQSHGMSMQLSQAIK